MSSLDRPDTNIDALGEPRVQSPFKPGASDAGLFISDEARIRYAVETRTGRDLPQDVYFEKAGPRKNIFFEPARTSAAIVT